MLLRILPKCTCFVQVDVLLTPQKRTSNIRRSSGRDEDKDDARKRTSWLYQGERATSETSQDQTLILQKSPSFSAVFGEGACAGWQESLSKLILLWFCPYAYYPYSLLFIISSLWVFSGNVASKRAFAKSGWVLASLTQGRFLTPRMIPVVVLLAQEMSAVGNKQKVKALLPCWVGTIEKGCNKALKHRRINGLFPEKLGVWRQ